MRWRAIGTSSLVRTFRRGQVVDFFDHAAGAKPLSTAQEGQFEQSMIEGANGV
jgi:hypothetical protein